jgi:predicted nucleic acid-binding Zn ribbon protein
VTTDRTPETDQGEDPGPEPDLAGELLARARASAGAPGSSAQRSRRRPRSRRWRSADPDFSGAGPDDRDPQPVGSVVDDIVDERGWGQPLAVGGVEGRWAQIVGSEVAAHCLPEEFDAGQLTVRTDSTAWATQVRLLAPTLLARLNDDLGAGTVTHLQVLGPRGPSWRKGKLRVKGRGPRDTYG